MAYTILKSDGTVLTTIPDGTINTTSTSLGLPGRNYPGYGQTLDTNFVHILESFADNDPPTNPIRGQLWYNTNNNTLYVCPVDGAPNANSWLSLTATASNAATTFGSVTVTGNLTANNITATNDITSSNLITAYNLTVSNNATIGNSTTTNANIGTLTTTFITSGSQSTNGTIEGVWTANGAGTANGVAGTSFWVTGGNLLVGGGTLGVKCDNYMLANGANLFSAGSAYSNSNVAAYLPTYVGNVGANAGATVFNGNVLSTGANTIQGNITGNWTFTTGSRLYVDNANVTTSLGVAAVVANGVFSTTANITSTANIYANSGTVGASIGSFGSLSTTGNITAANVNATAYHIRSVGTGISAAGASQGAATPLSKEINVVSTVSSGQGVVLPTAVAGMVVVINNTSANTLSVYPASGAAINSLSVNGAYSHVTSASLQYYAVSSIQWYTVGASYA